MISEEDIKKLESAEKRAREKGDEEGATAVRFTLDSWTKRGHSKQLREIPHYNREHLDEVHRNISVGEKRLAMALRAELSKYEEGSEEYKFIQRTLKLSEDYPA